MVNLPLYYFISLEPFGKYVTIYYLLPVGGWPTPLKNMKSIGIMTCPIYGKITAMFQTTNQISYYQLYTL